MADIELVVKMQEEVYKSIINGKNYISYQEYVEDALKNGTPLPKGHGKIIDESKITKCEQIGLIIKDDNITRCLITDAPTIIKADTERE